jgi:hypothetical protein
MAADPDIECETDPGVVAQPGWDLLAEERPHYSAAGHSDRIDANHLKGAADSMVPDPERKPAVPRQASLPIPNLKSICVAIS